MYVHYLIVFAIYITLIGSYSYIPSDISLSDAVQEGLSALDSVWVWDGCALLYFGYCQSYTFGDR